MIGLSEGKKGRQRRALKNYRCKKPGERKGEETSYSKKRYGTLRVRGDPMKHCQTTNSKLKKNLLRGTNSIQRAEKVVTAEAGGV